MVEIKPIEKSLVGLSDHNKIIYIVSDCCRVDQKLLLAPNKGKREICDARHIAAYLIRNLSRNYTLARIASILNRTPAATKHSMKVVPDLCISDKEFFNRFDRCNEAVKKYLN